MGGYARVSVACVCVCVYSRDGTVSTFLCRHEQLVCTSLRN